MPEWKITEFGLNSMGPGLKKGTGLNVRTAHPSKTVSWYPRACQGLILMMQKPVSSTVSINSYLGDLQKSWMPLTRKNLSITNTVELPVCMRPPECQA